MDRVRGEGCGQEAALGLRGPAVHWAAQGLYFIEESPGTNFHKGMSGHEG